MTKYVKSILSMFLCYTQAGGIFGDNLVMPPLEGKTGEEMAIIFLIGADCPQDGYVEHLKAIQEKVPYKLWVGIPHIVGDLPIPVGIGAYVTNMKKDLKKNHGVNVEKYIYGGHSLGASSIASWVQGSADDAMGTFLWGSYVGHSVQDPAKNYKSPVLTVGAEFDGWMARITRIAQSYD